MPLGNLRTQTVLGDQIIDGDLLNTEHYPLNQQHPDKKPKPQLQPHSQPKQITVEKAKAAATRKPRAKTKADKAVDAANKKDLNKRNIK